MALKKTLMIAGAVTSISLAGTAAGMQAVSAESNKSGLADVIAQKFHLNRDEVQTVLDQHMQEKKTERKGKVEERLTQAVSEGKLTEEQKAKILGKLEELSQERTIKRQDFKNMTPDQRHSAMNDRHDELKKWAQDNNIPDNFFELIGPGSGHKSHATIRDSEEAN